MTIEEKWEELKSSKEQEYAVKEFIAAVDLMLKSGVSESKIKSLFTEIMFQHWIDGHEFEESV
jgi:hypothetical protein